MTVVIGLPKVRQRLAALLEVSKGIGHVSADSTLEKIVQLALDTLPADRVALQTLNDSNALVPKAIAAKAGNPDLSEVPESVVRTALSDGVAILSDNLSEDRRFSGLGAYGSAICVPLISARRRLGAIFVDRSSHQRFTDDDLDFVVALAGIATAVIAGETTRG